MALMSKPLPPRPDLDALIVKARAAWDAMPPEKQREAALPVQPST